MIAAPSEVLATQQTCQPCPNPPTSCCRTPLPCTDGTPGACRACPNRHCTDVEQILPNDHQQAQDKIKDNTANSFNDHRDQIFTDTGRQILRLRFIPALQKMVEQMSAVAFQSARAIGTMIDAKENLEALRDIQYEQFKTYQSYQPSESFCAFGTNVRSLHAAESKMAYNMSAIGSRSVKRSLGLENTNSAGSKPEELASRWRYFTETYCRVEDNNGGNAGSTGLRLACPSTGPRPNIDVNYTELIEHKNNLQLDLTPDNPSAGGNGSNDPLDLRNDALDVLAMASHLYGHDILSRQVSYLNTDVGQSQYLALRSIAAKRSVAESSFGSIVALKSEGTDENAKNFLTPIVTSLGGSADDIGDKPSYYTQMEVLAKRLYQNPHFFASLYDSEINTERKSAAMQAIGLMVERAISESELRQEMMMSVLLASSLRPLARDAEQNSSSVVNNRR